MKISKAAYWSSTIIMCLIFLFSAYNYLFNYDMIARFYADLGFPTWIIYPSAVLKILGVVAILTRKSSFLKEWAYAGFFFDAVLALSAHLIAGDGGGVFAIVALIALVISRFFEPRIFTE